MIRKALTGHYLAISGAALLLYALVGSIAAPRIIRWYMPQYAQEALHCRVTVDQIRINPFLLTVEVNGFSLKQADGSQPIAFAKLFVDLETSSLFHRAIVLRELNLEKPDIRATIGFDGSIDLKKLATAVAQTPKPVEPNATPLPFILRDVTIRGGRIAVVDRRQSIPADFTLPGIDLHVQDLCTAKDHYGTYSLAATTEAGESLQWEGELSLSPLRSKGHLTLRAVRIAGLWEFFRDSINLEQPAGRIDVSTGYRLHADKSPVQLTLEELSVSVTDLSLKLLDADYTLLQLKKMVLDAPRYDLATKKLHAKNLLFDEGAVDVRIDTSGRINMLRIIDKSLPGERHGEKTPPRGEEQKFVPPPPAAPNFPIKVLAENVVVRNIAVDLEDESRKIPIRAAIAGEYLRLWANLETGNGGNNVVLQEISSEIRGISIESPQPHSPLFATEKLTIEGGEFDLGARSIAFDRIAMSEGRLDVGLDGDGKINWQQLFQTKRTAEKSTESEPAPDDVPAWKFLVNSFEVEKFSSNFSDLTTHSQKPIFGLQDLNARLTEVGGKSPVGFTVSFQGEQGGVATVSGTVNPAIFSVEADVDVSGMVVTSLQPYIDAVAALKLQSASVSARGQLRYGTPKNAQEAAYTGSFSLDNLRLVESASQIPYLSWDSAQIPEFKLTLQPNRLDAREIKISGPVGKLIIGEDGNLNLAGILKSRPDNTESRPFPQPAPTIAGAKARGEPFAYTISRVEVKNADMVFEDLSLRPGFMTRIHDLEGTVTGLSSVHDAQAKIRMDGAVDQYGIAKISGAIRPNDFKRSSDIDMTFRNVEMKSLSPYSGKLAGRLITSGKISANLKYKIQDYMMTGDNKIVIDNLVLGERVDAPEAADLPLDLAIALLQDTSGRIDVGLPVTGDLNDPQFSIGPLIRQMFTNLIAKATAAPFLALGDLLGGESAGLDLLEFDPGSARLLPPEQEKLLKLADALKSRPQLKLVVQGRYSPEIDGLEFKERSIRRIIAARLKEEPASNDVPEPLDFTDSDTQNALQKVYEERFGKASLDELEQGIEAGTETPRTPVRQQESAGKEAGLLPGMADGLNLHRIIPGGKSPEKAAQWAGELYIRLVESDEIVDNADNALLRLAENRAQAIVANLAGEGQFPKDHVSVKAPAPLPGDEHPSVSLTLEAF